MSGTALASIINGDLEKVNTRLAEINSFSDLNPQLLKEKTKLEKQKKILESWSNKSNENGNGGSMVDDKTKEIDDELKTIEARLKELSTYQFLPPSLKQEKDQLTKRQTELSSLRHQVENQQLTAAPTATTPAPAPTPTPQPIIEKPVAEKKSLIGDDYSVDKNDGGGIEDQIPSGDDAEGDKSDKKSEEITLTPKSEKIEEVYFKGNSSAALDKADKIIKSFNSKIEDYDGPDKDYLKGVVEEFSGMISSLSDKAKKSGMDDKTRERAIKGRLAIYIKSIESEFEFSELLDDDIKNQIKELAK